MSSLVMGEPRVSSKIGVPRMNILVTGKSQMSSLVLGDLE